MARIPYIRYLRNSILERVRHSTRFKEWLNEQATRLDKTQDEVYNMLKGGMSAKQISNLPNPEPEPEPDPEKPEQPEEPVEPSN